MKRSPSIMSIPLLISTLATMFCIWTFTHKSSTFCFTAGCSLFKDVSLAGFSPWQIAAGYFLVCVVCSVFRLPGPAHALSFAALAVDVVLLAILLFTAPCSDCLIVGLFLLLVYLALRREAMKEAGLGALFSRKSKGMPLLASVWIILFLFNLTSMAKSQLGVWCITDNAHMASVHMYFSPSCSACRLGVAKLSGRIDTAFFPVAEKEQDVPMIEGIVRALDDGLSMDEAVQKCRDLTEKDAAPFWSPSSLLLRFRLSRNKAHILLAGSQTVPFFEYHGLPIFLATPQKAKREKAKNAQSASRAQDQNQEDKSPDMPIDVGVFGYCGGGEPCEDGQKPQWSTKAP